MNASPLPGAKILTLTLFSVLVVACSQAATPTIIPTLALPPTQVPPLMPTETSPPTPEPMDTPTPQPATTETLTPAALTVTPTIEPGVCDADMLGTYAGVVGRLEAVYVSLEEQSFSQEAMLASIPRMEELAQQAQDLPAPCARALGLRQLLVDHIRAEIEDLQGFTTGTIKGAPPFEIWMDTNIERTLKTFWEDVEKGGEPEQVTAIPAFVCDCSGNFYDCAYFHSQEEAQGCFDYCLPRSGDVHELDENGDGIVCESLP